MTSGVMAPESATSSPDIGVKFDSDRTRKLVAKVGRSVIDRADELTALDAAIGDGDHGENMKRGFEAVLRDLDTLSTMSPPALCRALGAKLLSTVGGASGALYGTLFLALAKSLPPEPTRASAAAAFANAIDAVRARGKSDFGDKTMLDVLVPVLRVFAEGGGAAAVKQAAFKAAEGTIPMFATRGRASFLCDRSVGHMDPGARSSALMIAAICDQFGEN
jgi:phosphoenolpyruvate---glycerone phosphotransferase subunit DhaL